RKKKIGRSRRPIHLQSCSWLEVRRLRLLVLDRRLSSIRGLERVAVALYLSTAGALGLCGFYFEVVAGSGLQVFQLNAVRQSIRAPWGFGLLIQVIWIGAIVNHRAALPISGPSDGRRVLIGMLDHRTVGDAHHAGGRAS